MFEYKTEKRNSRVDSQINVANKKLVLHVRLRCGSLSITTPLSRLANDFIVRSELHGQVSLAFVNQICVVHEAMNGCKKKSKDSLKACFENVNISFFGHSRLVLVAYIANNLYFDQTALVCALFIVNATMIKVDSVQLNVH